MPDAQGVALPLLWPPGGALPNDAWLQARGTTETRDVAGTARLVVVAPSAEPIAAPSEPYVQL